MLHAIVFEPEGVVCTYTGHADLRDVLDAVRQYLTHPECAQLKYIVHDFTGAESFSYSENAFAGLAAYAIENYQGNDHVARCAVTGDETVKRSLELYGEITGRAWEFAPTLSAARGWAVSR